MSSFESSSCTAKLSLLLVFAIPAFSLAQEMISPEPGTPTSLSSLTVEPHQTWEDGFVFRTGVGACFQQALSGRNGSGLIYERFVFNPGIRLDLDPGYDLFPWLRLGAEASFLYNSLDSVQYNNLILHGAGAILSGSLDGDGERDVAYGRSYPGSCGWWVRWGL